MCMCMWACVCMHMSQVALRGRPSWLLLLDGGGLVYLIRILSRCISHNEPRELIAN